MENINYNESFLDPYFSNSDGEFANEIENFPILNFETDTYQSIKNKILQQNSNDENEDYDLNDEAEENIIMFDEMTDEIILNQFSLYICVECLEDNSGHLHQRLGRGVSEFGCDSKHDDLTVILEKFGNWIQLVVKLDNKLQKQQLIWRIDSLDELVLPTLLIVQIAFKLAKINLSAKTKAEHLKEKEYPDPNNHSLFDYTTQNTSKGYFNMETCYQHGIEHMQDLLVQEVYLTKTKNSKGRVTFRPTAIEVSHISNSSQETTPEPLSNQETTPEPALNQETTPEPSPSQEPVTKSITSKSSTASSTSSRPSITGSSRPSIASKKRSPPRPGITSKT
ncbi:23137_t:CDS:2 [Dentiscutata erythropus]|uniref:23137_t:CDS:1 n=1 Tax=Dentiscutata erythropus TaxID=1348616 RepID=A0A9N9BZD0_9GLOM|nr:23137_t:CDS:2 [Dentiscutata erythropus]